MASVSSMYLIEPNSQCPFLQAFSIGMQASLLSSQTQWYPRLNGTGARLPAWVLGGMASRVQSHAGASRGSIPGATTEHLHFLLFIVCRPIIGRDYFEEFHIHFISSFMLSVSSAYTKSSPSYMSEPPLKKKGGEPFKKMKKKRSLLSSHKF